MVPLKKGYLVVMAAEVTFEGGSAIVPEPKH